MKMFVFQSIDELTDRYHSDGGLVAVARDRQHVEDMIKTENQEKREQYERVGYITNVCNFPVITDEDWASVTEYELCGEYEPVLYIFPDAGCC